MLFVSLHSHLLKGKIYLVLALKSNVHQMIFTIRCIHLNPDYWLLHPNRHKIFMKILSDLKKRMQHYGEVVN